MQPKEQQSSLSVSTIKSRRR